MGFDFGQHLSCFDKVAFFHKDVFNIAANFGRQIDFRGFYAAIAFGKACIIALLLALPHKIRHGGNHHRAEQIGNVCFDFCLIHDARPIDSSRMLSKRRHLRRNTKPFALARVGVCFAPSFVGRSAIRAQHPKLPNTSPRHSHN